MKELTVKEMYTLEETIAKDIFDGVTYPWEVLPKIGGFILKLGESLSSDAVSYTHLDVYKRQVPGCPGPFNGRRRQLWKRN